MHRRTLALLAALLLGLALPASALAQQGGQPQPGSGAFGPLPPPAPEPTAEPEPVDPTPNDDGGDVGRPVLFAAGGGLLVLFAAIGMFISRDARRSLPRHGRELKTGSRDEGPHRKAREAKAKSRAKARAARRARKRNRAAH